MGRALWDLSSDPRVARQQFAEEREWKEEEEDHRLYLVCRARERNVAEGRAANDDGGPVRNLDDGEGVF